MTPAGLRCARDVLLSCVGESFSSLAVIDVLSHHDHVVPRLSRSSRLVEGAPARSGGDYNTELLVGGKVSARVVVTKRTACTC